MAKSFVELVVGSLDEKREWKKMMKRANALPEDYRFAYQKILHYFYNFGCNLPMLNDLIDLFEESAAAGKPVMSVVGSDVAGFCDELLRVNDVDPTDPRETLNREILEHFHREEH